MSDLRRWIEDAPPSDVRRLLEVGQWARPSRAALDETLLRVRAGASAGALDDMPPAEHGGLTSSSARNGIKWGVIGALLLGGIGALTVGFGPDEPTTSAVAVQPHEPQLAPAAPKAPEPIATPTPKPEPARVLGADAPAAPAGAKPQKSRATSAVAAPARAAEGATSAKVCKPGVGEQIAMLEQAKNLIQRRRGAEALAILDRYDRFGAGRCFVPESLKHRMDAYALTGNTRGAARTATDIKTEYPDTAQARAADAVLKQK